MGEESKKKMLEQAEQSENIRPTFMARIESYIHENAWDKAVAHLIGRGAEDANGVFSARACAVFNGRFDSCGAF